jgi:hypothetical protein
MYILRIIGKRYLSVLAGMLVYKTIDIAVKKRYSLEKRLKKERMEVGLEDEVFWECQGCFHVIEDAQLTTLSDNNPVCNRCGTVGPMRPIVINKELRDRWQNMEL